MTSDDDAPVQAPAAGVFPPPPSVLMVPPPIPASDGTGRERNGGRSVRWLLACLVAVAVGAAAVALVVGRATEPDPDDALAAAQAFVEAAGSYRFELRTTSRVQVGDPDGAGSDTTTRAVTTGDVAAPDRWHVVTDPGIGMFVADSGGFESIRIGDLRYEKDGFGGLAGVEEPRWVEHDADLFTLTVADLAEMYGDLAEEVPGLDFGIGDEFAAAQRLEMAMAGYLATGYSLDPSAVTRLVTEATDPVYEEALPGGGVRLRVRLDPVPEIQEVIDEPLPPVDLQLDIDDDDRPVLVQFTAAVDGASAEVTVTFTDWDGDIQVEAPDADEIDQTPSVQEEALATVPELLVLPATVPDGLELVGATVYEFDGEECPSVDLEYVAGSAEEMTHEELESVWAQGDYLSVSVSPVDCSADWDEQAFDQTFGGHPARGGRGYWEVTLGEAWVTIDSTYPDADLERVAASLRQVSVADLVASIPDWAADLGW